MIGIVVGLQAEARLLRRALCRIAVGGGTAQGAAAAAERLAPTVHALLSFGLAGGLDPALAPGAVLVPARVLDGVSSWATDAELNHALGGPTPHNLIGGGPVIATAEAKRAAFKSGAHAVDLESAAVARAAAKHGRPFAVLRAIADPSHRSLPQAALAALGPQGRIALLRTARVALANPAELPALIALAADAARARRALLARVQATPALNPLA